MAHQTREKRQDKRLSVKEGKIRYKGSGLFAFLEGASDKYPIVNISHRGLRFLTRDKIEVGDKLAFTIGIPLLGAPLKANGRVVWIQRSSRYNAFTVGVKFTVMTKKAISRLRNLVNFLGQRTTLKQKVKIAFSEEMRKQPLLWQIARDFEVSLNIAEGLLTDRDSWLVMEIEGGKEEIERVLEYLREKGGKLSFPKRSNK